MSKFGYTLSPSSRIHLNELDCRKFNRLLELEPDVLKCIGCGSCTATCSSGKFTRTSLRSAILAIRNGEEKEAMNLLKGCMLCGKCTMACPRAINTRHLILSICKIYQTK